MQSSLPLISESNVDGQKSGGEDNSKGGDDGQSGKHGDADSGRLDNLDGAIFRGLFAHPRDGFLVEEESVAGIFVLGYLDLVRAHDLFDRQTPDAFVLDKIDLPLSYNPTNRSKSTTMFNCA